MKNKFINKLLIIGIFVNCLNMNSFANILLENNRYESFNGSSIVVNNILEEGSVGDLEIEGNTMVNYSDLSKYASNGDRNAVSISPDEVIFSNPNTWSKAYYYFDLKPDTQYTVQVTAENNMDIKVASYIRLEHDISSKNVTTATSFDPGERSTKSKVFTTDNKGKVCFSLESGVSSSSLIYSEVMLIEGDYSNKKIDYFDGIKSSFQNQLITQEMIDNGLERQENLDKYKAEIKVSGKNIFTRDNLIYDKLLVESNTLGQNAIWACSDYIKVKPNTKYTLSNISGWYSYQYDINKNPIQTDRLSNNFITESNCEYIRVSLLKEDIDRAQIEIGEYSTPYEPYKETLKSIYLNEPLRSVPNGIKDKIIKRNGQWIVERNCAEIILDGSNDEGWFLNNDVNKKYTFEMKRLQPSHNIKNQNLCLSYPLKCMDSIHQDTGMSLNMWLGNGKQVRIISSDIDNLNDFINWLSNNPVTAVYQLDKPIYEPLSIDLSIPLYINSTYISNNSIVYSNFKFNVDRIVNRVEEALELVNSNPTVNNISNARAWINLMNESIKKDMYQNDLNLITDIEDLNIEKKSVTSNMDIYIKPENSLSMSLSTNHITFEDYSSVSDINMDNAVQITINSSLPYQLNSYLETEIQNEDGSSKINKDKFLLKEDGEDEYKQFLALNQKIVLKNECLQGNNIIHNIDFKLKASTHDADIYKTTIKFEVEQK